MFSFIPFLVVILSASNILNFLLFRKSDTLGLRCYVMKVKNNKLDIGMVGSIEFLMLLEPIQHRDHEKESATF